VIIYLGNVGVLLLGIPWLTTRVSSGTALAWWLACTEEVLQHLARWMRILS
jgi:hypothetical protein